MLLSSWRGVDVALVFMSIFVSMLWRSCCLVGLYYYSSWRGVEQFPEPLGQWFIVAIYACL